MKYISIKESLKICNLPVIGLKHESKVLYFIVDTGSEQNCISEETVKLLELETTESDEKAIGISGELLPIKTVELDLVCFDKEYKLKANCFPKLHESFIYLSDLLGVQIDGLLGTTFLLDNKLVLDYNFQIIYQKQPK